MTSPKERGVGSFCDTSTEGIGHWSVTGGKEGGGLVEMCDVIYE